MSTRRRDGERAVSAGVVRVDLPMLVLSAIVCLPVFFTDFEVSRREGVALITAFAAYLSWIVITAGGRQIPNAATLALLAAGGVVLALTFGSSLAQYLRSKHAP